MSSLPRSWVAAPIGDLCTLNNGRAFKPYEWRVTGVPIVRIQNLNKPAAKFNYYDGEVDGRYHLRGGELLFAWSGTPGTSFGAHIWKGGEAVVNQHIFRVDFDEALLSKRFFQLAINQKLGDLIDMAHGGVGLRHVTKGKFERTEIALPPHAEQYRIADKLDALLARVDACRERLDRIPVLLKRFRQIILSTACSGGLTEDWRSRASPSWPGWRTVRLGDVLVEMRNGLSPKPSEMPPGMKILRISAVRPGRLDLADHRYLELQLAEAEAYSLKQGDLLFTRYNGSLEFVGVCAVLEQDLPGYVYPDKLIRVRTRQSIALPKFIEIAFGSQSLRVQIEACVKSSAGQKGISGADLKNMQIDLPAPEEQAEIVRRVDALFALADRIEARSGAVRARIDKLTPALLAKAFRGELVPQDPADEPADVLLERIRAARGGAAAQPRRGRSAKGAPAPA